MHLDKVSRDRLAILTDLPNIGPAMVEDLRRLGITAPRDHIGEDPYVLYARLRAIAGQRSILASSDIFITMHGRRTGAVVVGVHGSAQAACDNRVIRRATARKHLQDAAQTPPREPPRAFQFPVFTGRIRAPRFGEIHTSAPLRCPEGYRRMEAQP